LVPSSFKTDYVTLHEVGIAPLVAFLPVDKNIFAAIIWFNESIPFRIVEYRDFPCRHLGEVAT